VQTHLQTRKATNDHRDLLRFCVILETVNDRRGTSMGITERVWLSIIHGKNFCWSI